MSQAKTLDDAFDCLAQAILVRDAWIAAVIEQCGVKQ